MSRSRRHTPVAGRYDHPSEKQDKAESNRRLRRMVRERLGHDPTAEVLPHRHEAGNPWTFWKDGKVWLAPERRGWEMRK